MKRVREIMVPVDQYPSVQDDATLRQAIMVNEMAFVLLAVFAYLATVYVGIHGDLL